MEAVGAASSITALLTIAVQSSKIVYETITTIRDGPNELQVLAGAVDELHRMLKYIMEITPSEASRPSPVSAIAGLEQSVRSCFRDLQAVHEDLCKIRPRVQDGALGRTRKRVMLVLRKDDVERLHNIIQRQTSNLSLQINIGNMNLALNNGFCTRDFQSKVADSFTSTNNLTMTSAKRQRIHVTEQTTKLHQQAIVQHGQTVERLATLAQQQNSGKQEMLQVFNKGVVQMKGSFHESTRSLVQDRILATDKVGDKVDALHQTFLSQFGHLMKKLNQMETQPKYPGTESQSPQIDMNQKATQDVSRYQILDSNFVNSLDRLYSFMPQTGKTLSARNAGKVVDEIDAILDIIGTLRSLRKPAPPTEDFGLNCYTKVLSASPTRRLVNTQSHEWNRRKSIGTPISTRCLKTMKAIARMSTKISVTDGPVLKLKPGHYVDLATLKQLQYTPHSSTSIQTGLETHDTSSGTLIVWSKSVDSCGNNQTTLTLDLATSRDDKTEKLFLAGVHFMPSCSSAIMSALFTQRITSHDAQFLDFSISYHDRSQGSLRSQNLDSFESFLLDCVTPRHKYLVVACVSLHAPLVVSPWVFFESTRASYLMEKPQVEELQDDDQEDYE